MFRSRTNAILITALVAGSLDIGLAFLNAWVSNGVTPAQVLRYVASGYFGKEAFTGGVPMALWGLLFHYLIAFAFTAFFFFLFTRNEFLARHKALTAIGYGLLVWGIMNLVVVPMSQVPTPKMEPVGVIKNMVILVVAIGIPVVFFSSLYRKHQARS